MNLRDMVLDMARRKGMKLMCHEWRLEYIQGAKWSIQNKMELPLSEKFLERKFGEIGAKGYLHAETF